MVMLARFFTDRGFKVYGSSRPKMKINDPTTGEMVSAGTGARGTRICMTIRHSTLAIEQALMDGLLPTRCSIDFKPQYPGDKARNTSSLTRSSPRRAPPRSSRCC